MGVWSGCGFCLNVSQLVLDSERRESGRVKTLFVLVNIFIYLQDFNQMLFYGKRYLEKLQLKLLLLLLFVLYVMH